MLTGSSGNWVDHSGIRFAMELMTGRRSGTAALVTQGTRKASARALAFLHCAEWLALPVAQRRLLNVCENLCHLRLSMRRFEKKGTQNSQIIAESCLHQLDVLEVEIHASGFLVHSLKKTGTQISQIIAESCLRS